MVVRLMQAGEHFSLEMDPDDVDAVRTYIRQTYPSVRASPAGIATVVCFGGSKFTFQNESDDPCLISGSIEGDSLLKSIYSRLNAIA